MPTSYQAPRRSDSERSKEVSQSAASNLSAGTGKVKDIIRKKGDDVFSIRPQDTLGNAVQLLSEKRIGALIVADANGTLLGILSERDIVRKLAETPGRTLPQKVEEVMTANVEVCTRDEPLISVLRRMTEGRFRHMPVMEDNRLVGIVTIGDVVNHRLNELEFEALQLKQLIVG
ncbi:CBS domain-containing protein [Kiloniella sp. b19]|uniref:CBS domain-containing protein n=1 Tax=Kiloniella sp. GXU_MW_B19 TaxID=3141326 RepID=UPI0031D58F86